jgi:hypothetical protein
MPKFRVPSDPDNPTFDDTFEVNTRQWMTSSKADRLEWQRRRNAAAKVAKTNQDARAEAWAERKIAEGEARREAKRQDGEQRP